MLVVNVASCDPDEEVARGAFRCAAFDLTERLGAGVIGATVFEMKAGDKRGPYHYHHGVEEWMYVVSGMPILRDRAGERALEPGELVAFPSGPLGAHTVHGPGRIVMFSAGASGWGEAFVTVYLDSDKIGAAPGVKFRRADALDSWTEDTHETSGRSQPERKPALDGASPAVNLMSVDAQQAPEDPRHRANVPRVSLGARLGAQTWDATLYELSPNESTGPYQYQWCREQWVLVLRGAATLRHSDGEMVLNAGDIACFGEGPGGAHRLLNKTDQAARLLIFSTPTGRPMTAFYPDEGTVQVRISDHEGFLFRVDDQIQDYWDGEPGAGDP